MKTLTMRWIFYGLLLTLSISLTACSVAQRRSGQASVRNGRIYIEDSTGKHRFNFRMEYDSRSLSMILASPWGDSVAYISYEEDELLVKDGDGRRLDSTEYLSLVKEIFHLLNTSLPSEGCLIRENIEIEFSKRDEEGFPRQWVIREGSIRIKVVFL